MNCAHNILLSNGGGYPPHATPNRASFMTDERKYTPDVRVYGLRSTHGDDQAALYKRAAGDALKSDG